MNTKTLAGGLAGAVVFFLLGWLVYGMLLSGYYDANTNQCMAKAAEGMTWWSLIAFNVVWGFFFAIIFSWAGTITFMDGLIKGAIIGFLVILTFDLQFYTFTTLFAGKTIIALDVVAGTVFNAIGGGIIALVMSKVS